eukprot:Transcript_3858.p2 GENE.Transcript_3858~~Transcript_3858.p2  ORF type:complete len:213 (-),score=64.15 Transcript_3858:118-756(-)
MQLQAHSALAISLALGSTWRWPLALRIGATYGAMVLAQRRGSDIIRVIHNSTAAAAAAAPPEDVAPDTAFEALCDGYESHHWEATSNCLHACGMLLVFAFTSALLFQPSWHGVLRLALAVPPTWYLYAWAGHFLYQADVPAVFTYGMTLRGWAAGELCSIRALVFGRTVGPYGPNESVGREELLLTAALIVVYVAAAWPAWRRPAGTKRKAE